MSSIRSRGRQHTSTPDNKTKPVVLSSSSPSSTLTIVIYVLRIIVFSLIVNVLASSYFTDSWFWGYKGPYTNPRWLKYKLSSMVGAKERVFTMEELAIYDGRTDSTPIYISIMGKVYDVSAGRKMYGPGAGYHGFAGKEGARAFVTGCFGDPDHFTHDIRDLSEDDIRTIKSWQDFYENSDKYFPIGNLNLPEISPSKPIPKPCQ